LRDFQGTDSTQNAAAEDAKRKAARLEKAAKLKTKMDTAKSNNKEKAQKVATKQKEKNAKEEELLEKDGHAATEKFCELEIGEKFAKAAEPFTSKDDELTETKTAIEAASGYLRSTMRRRRRRRRTKAIRAVIKKSTAEAAGFELQKRPRRTGQPLKEISRKKERPVTKCRKAG